MLYNAGLLALVLDLLLGERSKECIGEAVNALIDTFGYCMEGLFPDLTWHAH